MNKSELIAAMVEASGLTKKDCEAALTAFTGAVETAMKSGDKVQMVGFDSFARLERIFTNIHTKGGNGIFYFSTITLLLHVNPEKSIFYHIVLFIMQIYNNY